MAPIHVLLTDAVGILEALLHRLPLCYHQSSVTAARFLGCGLKLGVDLLSDSALAAYRQYDVVTARRSGITVGGQVGKHLRMHPATVVTAKFPEVRQQTSVSLVCSMPLKAKMASSEIRTIYHQGAAVHILAEPPMLCRRTGQSWDGMEQS